MGHRAHSQNPGTRGPWTRVAVTKDGHGGRSQEARIAGRKESISNSGQKLQ